MITSEQQKNTTDSTGAERLATELKERFEAIGEQLRAKITSKFQTSAFLAGIALAVLTVEISMLWERSERPLLLPVSISVVVAAVVLFVRGLIELDALTMPKRFWPEDGNQSQDRTTSQLAYLEDEDLRRLFNLMAFYWTKLTLTATILTTLGALALVLPWKTSVDQQKFATLGVCVMAGFAVTYCAVLKIVAKRRYGNLIK